MRILLLGLLLPFCLLSFSQETPFDKKVTIKKYVPLKTVVNKGITLTEADSLAFHFSDGDTLVLLTPTLEPYFDFLTGIRVKVEPQDSLFIEKYKDVVFGSPKRSDRKKQNLRIWKDGIRIYFDKSVPRKHRRALLKFSKELDSEVDSLNIRKVSNRNDANYLVFYKNDPNDFDLEPRVVNDKSGYYLNWEKNNFSRASLKVNTFSYENEQEIINDLKKRFFETLGYFRNSNRFSCGSLLSNCGENKSLSNEDLEILKYHYSYQNCYGIDVEEFECQHERRRENFAEHSDVRMYVVHPKE